MKKKFVEIKTEYKSGLGSFLDEKNIEYESSYKANELTTELTIYLPHGISHQYVFNLMMEFNEYAEKLRYQE